MSTLQDGLATFSQGLVTNPDRSTLQDGELRVARGEYRLGSSEYFKPPGRSKVEATGLSSVILNLARFQYESVTDVFVAVAGDGKVYEATPGTSMTFGAAVLTGLNTSAIPQFTSFKDTWIMCNGEDDNYIRELGNVPGTSSPWRTVGMKKALGQTAVTVSTDTAYSETAVSVGEDGTDSDSDGPYALPSNLFTDDNYALGQLEFDISNYPVPKRTHIFDFDTNPAGTGRRLFIRHSGDSEYNLPSATSTLAPDGNSYVYEGVNGIAAVSYLIRYSTDGGSTYTTIFNAANNYSERETTINIADGLDISTQLIILCKVSVNSPVFNENVASHRIFDIRVSNGAESAKDVEFGLQYMVTERYVDSNEVTHESIATDISASTGVVTDITSVSVTLPDTQANSFASEFVIYRTIDEEAGGFPFLWEVGTAPISEAGTSWLDDLSKSLTSSVDKRRLYPVLTILFQDGLNRIFEVNKAPPKSKLILQFQGSLAFLPVSSNRLYYSLPATLAQAALEQSPAPYYLEFNTPANDTLQSMALTNGERSLVVFFSSRAMLVNYFPQSTDGGAWVNSVKEVVSDKRGASGKFCSTTFSPNEGDSTLAAAVDSIGLWVTNGVGLLQDWSRDLDWDTTFENVTIGDSILVDNAKMRRLELIYLDGSDWKELHFFYGELKQNGQPKISGPFPAGWRCKHYAVLDGKWQGWSGDSGSDGFVFAERTQAGDDSEAEDASGTVTFDAQTGDIYPGDLSDASVLTFLYPKLNQDTDKAVTVAATTIIDGEKLSNNEVTISQTYNNNKDKKLMIKRYCNRMRLRVTDATTTDMPALSAVQFEHRPLGQARDL